MLLACAGLGGSVAGAEEVPSPLVPVQVRSSSMFAGVAVELDGSLFRAVRGMDRVRLTDFSLPGGGFATLELERFEVLTPDARVVEADGFGERAVAAPDVAFFRGIVAGEPGSRVFLALSPAGNNGFIERSSGMTLVAASGETSALVYDIRDLAASAFVPMNCETVSWQGGSPLDAAPRVTGTPATLAGQCRAIRVAIDTDWEYRSLQRFTSAEQARAYALTLTAAVSEIYRRDLNITLEVPYLRTWTSDSDPYGTSSSLVTRLTEMRNSWRANQSGVSRDVTHLLSGARLGAGGAAFTASLCDTSFGYSASGYLNGTFPLPIRDRDPQNWDLHVMAHELAHNFGAMHTHDLTPPIDRCGLNDCSQAASVGTIMSYCNACGPGYMSNIALTLHPRMINERILPYLNGSAASCGRPVPGPAIVSAPADQTAHPMETVVLSAQTTATSGANYRWHLDGRALSDGITPRGSVITGSATASMRIDNIAPGDEGDYQLRVDERCGSLTTSARVGVLCTSDLSADGRVDLSDFFLFIGAYENFEISADVNRNGEVELGDYFLFVGAYERGCD